MVHVTRAQEHEYAKIVLPELSAVPTLTTDDEKKYLYWLTKKAYQGKGAVVEIGTWFGSSAGYLAAGLRDAEREALFYCFDRFSFSNSERARVRDQGFDFEYLAPGRDTAPIVQRHLDAIYSHSTLIKTSIAEMTWDNGPVELLHLDAPKRASDIVHVLKIFSPYLIPNESAVVVQDFCVPRAYALPLLFGALSDSFELAQVPSPTSTTVTFMYKKPYQIDAKLDIARWQSSRALEVVQSFLPAMSAEQQNLLMLGLAFFCYDHGDKDMAEEIIKNF